MTTTGIIQIMRGITADPNADYYGESYPNIGGSSLHGAYFFGNQQKMVYSKGYDYSFHQRALTITGSPTRGNGFSTPDASNYYTLPFTDTDLINAGVSNEYTICAVVKTGGVSDGTIWSAEQTVDLGGTRAWISSSGTFSPHAYDADGPSGSTNPQIVAGSSNGQWEFVAFSLSSTEAKSYRKGSSSSWVTNTVTPSPASVTPSGLQFLVGRRTPNTSTAGGISINSIALYNRVMTLSEIQNSIYTKVKSFLVNQTYAMVI